MEKTDERRDEKKPCSWTVSVDDDIARKGRKKSSGRGVEGSGEEGSRKRRRASSRESRQQTATSVLFPPRQIQLPPLKEQSVAQCSPIATQLRNLEAN